MSPGGAAQAGNVSGNRQEAPDVSLGELEEDASGGLGVDERDPAATGSHPGLLIDQAVPPRTAGGQCLVEIGNPVADMMDTRSAPLEKFRDGTVGSTRLEQLDLGFAKGKGNDAGAVGRLRRMRRDAEHVAIEWQRGFDALDRDTDMGDDSA